MLSGWFVRARGLVAAMAAAAVLWVVAPRPAAAQIVRNAVGGVSISPDGVLGLPSPEDRAALLEALRSETAAPPVDLAGLTELRKVSLRGLEAAIAAARASETTELPAEVRYLAGLQRIRYVFVYPERNDIVLAGPGEGWRINDEGIAVGVTTGQPCLLLEDLVIALRTADAARRTGISCSIDPTEQGYRNLTALLDRQRRSRSPVNPARLEAAMKQAFGPQQVKLTGVPADTHFARVMVAADWRMKRLAMNLEPAPVAGLPSFVELIKNARVVPAAVNPRWWLACDYEPLARSNDGLAWELRGRGVKALTEDEVITAEGRVNATGGKNPAAERWAELLTERYEQLAARTAVFGQLRNLMDMCVVAALIEKHDLLTKAGCQLPLLCGDLSTAQWNPPRRVAPECSFLRTRHGWLVTASGGVQIDSWSVASREEVSEAVQRLRRAAAQPPGAAWRWN